MKKILATWCEFKDGNPHKMYPHTSEAIILDPDERVINIERVRELVSSMEAGAVIRGGQHLMERWGELRKELGLE